MNGIGQRTTAHYSGEVSESLFFYPEGVSAAGTYTYGYNANGELVSQTGGRSHGYQYDLIGNRLSTSAAGSTVATYQPNALNQYDWIDTGSGPLAPSHDEDGNLEHDGTKIYGWDAENRLVSVKRASDNQPIASYAYDYMGRRIHKQTTAIAPQGASETVFLYDGWNLSAEYAVSGSPPSTLHPQRTYTWGLDLSGTLQGAGGVGGLLAFENKDLNSSSQGVYYPLYDGNGNVLATLKDTGTSTAVAGAYHYDPFGKTLLSAGSNMGENPFRFSTKYFDGETGFYYYGYRHYDPVTGRWLSRDPIQENGGVNLYAFLGNSGIDKWDVLGLAAVGTAAQYPEAAVGMAQGGATAEEIVKALGLALVAAEAAVREAALRKRCDELAKDVRDAKDDPNLSRCTCNDSDAALALKIVAWEFLAISRWTQNQECSKYLKTQKDIDEHIKKQQEAYDNWVRCLKILSGR